MKNPDAGSPTPLVHQPEPTFADHLQAWRDARSLTQVQTAALLRVPLSTYRGWEQGRPSPFAYVILTALSTFEVE